MGGLLMTGKSEKGLFLGIMKHLESCHHSLTGHCLRCVHTYRYLNNKYCGAKVQTS